MSSRAPVGYLAVAQNPVTTNQGVKAIVPRNGFSSSYVYYQIAALMPVIEANASGSTFKEISTTVLSGIRLPLPASALVEEFDRTLAGILGQQENLEVQNRELTSLRDWLLPLLMSGQVEVS